MTGKRLVIAGVILACAVVVAIAIRSMLNRDPSPNGHLGTNVPPIQFTDVTDSAGIRFRHISGATPQKLLPETMGSGVAVIDFDGDGWPDLFFVNSRPWPGQPPVGEANRTQSLYRNRGDGTFEDVTKAVGLDVELFGMGVAVGDYDNDGWPDLFVTAVGGNRLFHNMGGKRFEDVTVRAGLGEPMPWPKQSFEEFLKRAEPISFPSSATFVDYDGDGRLDLFVCNYVTWSPAADVGTHAVLPGNIRAYVPPQLFTGAHCSLFRNLGGGKFMDVSQGAGVQVSEGGATTGGVRPVGKALGVVVCDPDNDGWPDLVVANDTQRNFFLHNVPDDKGGRRFREEGQVAGLAYADGRPRGGMGIDAGEILPGELAVVVANFSSEPVSLFRRLGTKPIRFADMAQDIGLAGTSRYPMKFGATFFDCDLDGRPDLFLANGHLEPDIPAAQPGETHAQRSLIFWNTGDSHSLFVPADPEMFRPMVGRGCAYLDFDGDGDLDLVVTDNNGRARLFRNDTKTANRSIRLTLTGSGKSNRDAIGATVEAAMDGAIRTWLVSPTRGYLSQSEKTITIGVGGASKIDRVSVRWPGPGNRRQQWLNLEAGRSYNLIEGEAEAQVIDRPKR